MRFFRTTPSPLQLCVKLKAKENKLPIVNNLKLCAPSLFEQTELQVSAMRASKPIRSRRSLVSDDQQQMAHSDSEDEVEGIDDLDFDGRSSDADDGNDDDVFKLEAEEDAEEGTEADEVRRYY